MGRSTELSASERELVRRCLDAAVNGPLFPEWEFGALFGMERPDVRRVLDSWPATHDEDLQEAAVTGAMNNLLSYPHRKDAELQAWVGAAKADIARALASWLGRDVIDLSPRGYFDRLR